MSSEERRRAVERRYIDQLAVGDSVKGAFALRAKELRAARNGEAYLTLELADRTGRIGAVMFRPDQEASAIPAGTVVQVRGTMTSYRGISRVSVTSVRPASVYEPAEILPAGTRDTGELVTELRALVRTVTSPELKAVLRGVFGDASFMARFKLCPASQGYHHAYLGGLLEHTVAVATLAVETCALHARLDQDLLLTAAITHDLGRSRELTLGAEIGVSDEGRLLGHVELGLRMLAPFADAAGLDEPRRLALEHCVLAHHGADALPGRRFALPEALALHRLNTLDASVKGAIEHGMGHDAPPPER
jgi:3'-5' exoribonuclease